MLAYQAIQIEDIYVYIFIYIYIYIQITFALVGNLHQNLKTDDGRILRILVPHINHPTKTNIFVIKLLDF